MAILLAACPTAVSAAEPEGSDVLLKALGDEIQRSMSLRLGEFPSPYFVQYAVDDTSMHRMHATYGALVSSTFSRTRELFSQLRVGSYEFDNSNFAGRGGFAALLGTRGTELPTDDDYLALRHAVWSATDSLYKTSVATLAQKRAYVRERNVGERSHDFTKVDGATTDIQDRAEFSFRSDVWEEYIRGISAEFGAHSKIQDSSVNLLAGAETRYLLNSEGTRLRFRNRGVSLRVTAEAQAADGQRLSDSLNYFAWTPDQLPKLETVLADVKELSNRLEGAAHAPILEDYTGPVLVDGLAASQLFRQLLAQGLAAQVEPVGAPRRVDAEGLEGRLGKRILPVTFRLYDDPRQSQWQDTYLAGCYPFDDEGIPPQRVELVVDGKLERMVAARTPTKSFGKSTGHGRRGVGSATNATIGCLFVESNKGASPEELKQELIDAADADGLEFGLRITHLQNRAGPTGFGRRGGSGPARLVGDPISIYKVFVKGGREEPVRGCEFVALDVRSLRRIVAAGKNQTVHNNFGGVGAASSVIAPAVLFEELELARIQQEAEKKPILVAPHARQTAS
jgi:predicted Zn-dependent protease